MILLRGCSSSWIQNIKIFLMSMGLILIRNKIVIVKFNCSKQIFLGMLNLHNIHSWWKVDVKNNLDNTKLLVCKWLITRILHYYIKIMKGKCWCNIQWFITVLWYNLLIHSLRKMLTWALNLRKTNWKSEALTDRDRHNFFLFPVICESHMWSVKENQNKITQYPARYMQTHKNNFTIHLIYQLVYWVDRISWTKSRQIKWKWKDVCLPVQNQGQHLRETPSDAQ